jgi:magnesium chelatase accessory protein
MTHSAIPARLPRDWPHREFSLSANVGGLQWHVQVAGRGPTILLLHGTGSSAHSWADLLPTLAEVSTVLVPDLPGHGYTTGASQASLTLPRIAADLDALLCSLQLPPVKVVVGHSSGGALALRWACAARRPSCAVIGFNPSLVPPPALYTTLLSPLLTPIATSSLVTSFLAAMSARGKMVDGLLDSTRSAIPPAQRARYATLFSDAGHVRGTMGFMAAADLPALLAEIRGRPDIQSTFVLGSQDYWVPEQALRRIIEGSFPDAKVLRWDGGHLLHEAQPERAAHLIRAVLAETLDTNGA